MFPSSQSADDGEAGVDVQLDQFLDDGGADPEVLRDKRRLKLEEGDKPIPWEQYVALCGVKLQ